MTVHRIDVGSSPQRDATTPLTRWLLAVPQARDGVHAGAIAGTLDDGVAASYVYPEIVGYYLRWLAFRATMGDDVGPLAAKAAAAQRWLAHWCGLPVPLTRVHLDGHHDDWRNDALFCFDLAMVLRGLASAVATGLVMPDPAVLRGVSELLTRCIGADGAFDAVVPLPGRRPLPVRWSTRRGAFLTKAATGVLRAATKIDVEARLRDAAQRTQAQSIAALDATPHAEAHPLLYACEGILDFPDHPSFAPALPLVSRRLGDVLARVDEAGYVPESLAPGATGPERIDVIAQVLRVVRLCRVHGMAVPGPGALQRAEAALRRHVHGDGGVSFSRASPGSQRNCWAAMFADQALSYAVADPARIEAWRRDPLLV